MKKTQIIADLKKIIGPGPEVEDAGLGVWVNGAYLYMCDAVAQANPDYFTAQDTVDIEANRSEYELPDDFEKMLMVSINTGSGYFPARVIPTINQALALANPNAGQSQFTVAMPGYYIFGGRLGILPQPTTNITDGIKIWYQYSPLELEDGDEPVLPKKYHYIIKYGAYADYLDQDDRHQDATAMRNLFEQRIEMMVENLSQLQAEEPKSITITNNSEFYINDDIL